MSSVRHDWTVDEVEQLLARPFHDLLSEAHAVHREHFDPHVVEAAILLSIKTGACPEDCAYCPQSARWSTPVSPEPLLRTSEIVAAARNARAAGATRFCMGAAWRSPNDRQVGEQLLDLVDGPVVAHRAHAGRIAAPGRRDKRARAPGTMSAPRLQGVGR